MRMLLKRLPLTIACCLIQFHAIPSNAQGPVNVSFQNGTNGYTGTVDQRISTNAGDESLGRDSASFFLDGFASNSPDTQALIRFDDIFGDSTGQIPTGATILDARLTVNTSLAGNAQTSGPYGVAALLEPFDEFTTYEGFEANADSEALSRGPWWQDGTATRPLAGFGFQLPGIPDTAVVTPLVQAWSTGTLSNNGFVLQAGRSDLLANPANTSDGWSIRTTGFPIASTRPMLEVEYTTATVATNVFQEGVDDYSGTTMAIVRSGTSAVIEDAGDLLNPEITEDGLDLDQTFLDGVLFSNVVGDTESPDDFALVKFDGVFGSLAGQAPSDVPVAKAWAVLTTGDSSTNAITSGPWSAHAMLRDWDTSTLHSSFGDINGLQVEDGDISPELDSLDGFIVGAEVWFDVTEHMEAVRTGSDNFGIAVLSTRTADGWQINTTGAGDETVRPRLVILSADLMASGQTTLDCNGDGIGDGLDLACVHTTTNPISGRDILLASIPSLAGDFDANGDVSFSDFLILSANFGSDNQSAPAYTDGNIDMQNGVDFADFLVLSSNFGGSAVTAAAVPEPTTDALLGLGLLGILGLRRRSS